MTYIFYFKELVCFSYKIFLLKNPPSSINYKRNCVKIKENINHFCHSTLSRKASSREGLHVLLALGFIHNQIILLLMFFWLDFIEAKVKLNYTILISYYLRDTLFFFKLFSSKSCFYFFPYKQCNDHLLWGQGKQAEQSPFCPRNRKIFP